MQENCIEIWKDIKGYEGLYQVSNFGRVKSLARERYCGFGKYIQLPERILGLNKRKDGYRWVTLRNKSTQKMMLVHRIVLETFVGVNPPGMNACHNDGIPSNNRLENLRWDTQKENMTDCLKHGTALFGEDQTSTKLTENQVREIRFLYAGGRYTQRELADLYGLESQMTVSKIIRYETWRHI